MLVPNIAFQYLQRTNTNSKYNEFKFTPKFIMEEAYHIKDSLATYFLIFQVENWIDVFTSKRYRDIVVQSFNYCIKEKGLVVYAWVIMSNHIHCIVNSTSGELVNTIRDLKSFTAKQIIKSIQEEPESRKEWLLIQFKQSGLEKVKNFNYGLTKTTLYY